MVGSAPVPAHLRSPRPTKSPDAVSGLRGEICCTAVSPHPLASHVLTRCFFQTETSSLGMAMSHVPSARRRGRQVQVLTECGSTGIAVCAGPVWGSRGVSCDPALSVAGWTASPGHTTWAKSRSAGRSCRFVGCRGRGGSPVPGRGSGKRRGPEVGEDAHLQRAGSVARPDPAPDPGVGSIREAASSEL